MKSNMQGTLKLITASALLWSASAIAQEQGSAAASDSAQQSAPDPQTLAKVAAVQDHVDAYRSRNMDRFIATFTPDAEVHANGLVAVGHDEIRALYRLNFAPDAPTIRIEDSGVSGEYVFLSVGYIMADGAEMCCSYSEYEITNGKVSYIGTSG